MLPPKRVVDRAFEDGTIDKVNRLLSAVHILNMEADIIVDEAAETLQAAGLQLGTLKKRHSDFIKCADRYFREFAEMITEEKSKKDMFNDIEEFDNKFRRWAAIEYNKTEKEKENDN